MRLFYKISFVSPIIGLLLLSGCIKFEDPPIVGSQQVENYASPCASELTDNEVITFTDPSTPINIFNFVSPVCSDTGLDYVFSDGSFEIALTEPITESGTIALDYPFVDEGEAQIQLRTSLIFTAPTYYSNSGLLYVEVEGDGTVIIEWCDIPCQLSGNSSSIVYTSGRIVCD